jgi:hypothetical protein
MIDHYPSWQPEPNFFKATNQRTEQSPNSEIEEGEDHAADPPNSRSTKR